MSLLRIRWNPLFYRSKKMLSFFSNDGWSPIKDFPSTSSDSSKDKDFKFFDHKVFLRNVEKGTEKPVEGKTTGEIPNWVKGTLLQNGPGKFKFGDSEARHWFDGASVIQKFTIKDGVASYECQLLNTETFRRNTKANKHVVSEFATPALPDPCHTIFQRFQAMFSPFVTDNCAVSIYPIDGNLFALTETPKIHQLDVENVKSTSMIDLNKNFHIMSQSAHPHVTKDGTVYNVSLAKGEKGPAYAIYQIPNKQGEGLQDGKVVAKIPTSWQWNPAYMHSFGLTDNYFIVIEQPLTISIKSLMASSFFGSGYADAFRWKDVPVNFHVIDRKNGERKTYTANNFFFFHTINQYEEDGHIVLDICSYDNGQVIKAFMVDALKGENWLEIFNQTFSGKPLRFVIPLSSEGSGNLVKLPYTSAAAEKQSSDIIHLKPEIICNEFCELARFHYDEYLGKKYNYFYGLCFSEKIDALGKLMKVDIGKKKVTHEWYEANTSPSEPIFIPSPGAKNEDDGVLVFSLLSSQIEQQVSLIILDAKDFKELSRTVFNTPTIVPKSIHGWFS